MNGHPEEHALSPPDTLERLKANDEVQNVALRGDKIVATVGNLAAHAFRDQVERKKPPDNWGIASTILGESLTSDKDIVLLPPNWEDDAALRKKWNID